MSQHILNAAVLALVALAAGIFVLPFLWMFSTSLKTWGEARTFPPPLFPAVPQWQNYATAFTRAPLLRYGLNSLVVCVSVIILTVVLTVMATYALVYLDFRGKELVFIVLLAPQMVSGVILLLPLFAVLHSLRMLNTLPALIAPYAVLFAPFAVFLLRGYMGSIPKELVEAARVDGASELWTLTSITVPLVKPALATIALFCFIWSWNEFLFALVYLQKPDLRTITVGIALLDTVPNFPRETNIIMAGATVVTLPALIVFSLMQRQFIQGVTVGAIK